jgi:uncharacterized damage-inducible protein DinB
MTESRPEVWMRGPVSGFEPWLQPAVHAFLQVREDIERLANRVPDTQVWARPGDAASIGFHLRHIGGATDRLLTYARGAVLTPAQFAAMNAESTDTSLSLAAVVAEATATLDRALDQLRATSVDMLLLDRKVGRAGLPSTTLGLIFHAAEHATRHVGQAITTAKILSGTNAL